MRRFLCVAALLLATLPSPSRAAATAASSPIWIGIPALSSAEIDRLTDAFDLRGTYGELTLAVGSEATLAELRSLHPAALPVGDFRPTERLFVVHLAPGETLTSVAEARLLLETPAIAVVALPVDRPAAIEDLLGERRAGLFHQGIAAVPRRRLRRQMSAPVGAPALEHDARVQTWVDSVSASNLETDVTSLSTMFLTRRSDMTGGSEAQTWLVERFSSLGLATTTHSFDSGADNVIAEIPGALEPEKVVIVGAHYDSITFSGSVAPGADDNASGTSALLEIARILAAEEASFRYTLRFIAFAAEEFGLVGSDAYSGLMKSQGVEIVAMLNTDMNAYRKSGDVLDLDMVTSSTTSWLTDELIAAANLYVPDLPTRKGTLSGGSSDHASFFNDGFPAAFYFEDTGDYSPYIHSSGDVVGTSANDFELSRGIVQAVLAGAAVKAEPVGDPAPDQLTVAGTCPGDLTIQVTDVTPNAEVWILRGRSEGSSEVPSGSCRGTVLGLAQPRILAAVTADAGGTATLLKRFPNAGCGLFLQAMDRDTCATTNVLQVP